MIASLLLAAAVCSTPAKKKAVFFHTSEDKTAASYKAIGGSPGGNI